MKNLFLIDPQIILHIIIFNFYLMIKLSLGYKSITLQIPLQMLFTLKQFTFLQKKIIKAFCDKV